MGLHELPWGDSFHLLKHLAEIKGAVKAQPVSHFVYLYILVQQQGFSACNLLLGDIFGETNGAGLLKKGA